MMIPLFESRSVTPFRSFVRKATTRAATCLLATAMSLGCAADPAADSFGKGEGGKADSSIDATFVNMDFEGELYVRSAFNVEQEIENQLLYTVGQLNGDRSVARMDTVQLTNVVTESVDGFQRVRYHARLPVAWGMRDNVPEEYTLRLPANMTPDGLNEFAEKYGHDCVDSGAHDVTSNIMWYYYRPARSRCNIDEGDVLEFTATVSPSDIETTGKFPEYDRVWEDGVLKVVAVFGKYEDDATNNYDAGIAAYNSFLEGIQDQLRGADLNTIPEQMPRNPGVELPEATFTAELEDGSRVEVVAILVDNVRTAGADFDARYGELSTDADLIFYNGHAGLGANIRALARKGEWTQGQYAIVFMNGCDTYAYVDSALWDAHAAVNPDDPEGTKHMDIVMNALPSFFRSMPRATLALIDGLMSYDEPQTYEQIFQNVDRSQVVLVSGEQDNEFVPGGGVEPPPGRWDGLSESGSLAAGDEVRFETQALEAGRYVFVMRGSGDADLYVRIGDAPSSEVYDCRPYRSDSSETCEVEIGTPAPVHVMVRGYGESSFALVGATE